MVAVLTPRVKAKNSMRIMAVYGASVVIASLVYWSIGYLLFAGSSL